MQVFLNVNTACELILFTKKTFSDDVHNEAPVSCLSAHIPVLLAIVQDIQIHIFEGTSSQSQEGKKTREFDPDRQCCQKALRPCLY